MDANKAVYWIALGVLALGLNSEYQHGSFVALHRVAEHAGSALCRMATRAEETLAGAEMARAQEELLRDQARDEAELLRDRLRDEVHAQADAIRAQVEEERAEIEQTRIRMRSQVRLVRAVDRRVTMVCPKTGVRIAVNAGMRLAEVSPDVEDSF